MIRKKRIILTIVMLIVVTMLTACSGNNADTADTAQPTADYAGSKANENSETENENQTETETESEKEIVFPMELDNGNLIVNSLFQSSIENPDCNDEYGDDIASLEVVNQSGKLLESADITLHMNDGMELHMQISDLPAGQKVWVFDNKNNSITDGAVCVSIDCKADYLDEVPMMANMISVETSETSVTLTNRSEETLSGLTVKCHCSIDGVYYGGLTYSYPVDELSPDKSTVIEADDCFLGTAVVVRISK